MIIAGRFERDRRFANLAWAGGIVAVVALTASLWPSIEGSASFDDVIDDLRDSVKALIGAQGGISLGTPAGYLNARIFATLLPVLIGTAVGMLDDLSLLRLAGACGGVTVLGGLHASIAFAVGAATGHPGSAVAVAATVAVAGYLLAGLLTTTSSLDWLQALSPWHWLLDRNVLVNGTPPIPLMIELAFGITLVAFGIHRFNRRDLH